MTTEFSNEHFDKLKGALYSQTSTTFRATPAADSCASAQDNNKIDALTFLEKARHYIRKAHDFASPQGRS